MDGNWSLGQAGILEEAHCELTYSVKWGYGGWGGVGNGLQGGRKNIPCFWLAQIAPKEVLVDSKYGKFAFWQPLRNPEIGIQSDGPEWDKLSNHILKKITSLNCVMLAQNDIFSLF